MDDKPICGLDCGPRRMNVATLRRKDTNYQTSTLVGPLAEVTDWTTPEMRTRF